MKPDSKIFDRIRVKPDQKRTTRDSLPPCEWAGCENPGTHPAPMGRGAEGKFHRFCIDHVRLYNKSYNYFSGMQEEAVAAYHKDSLTGHRPTWTIANNARDTTPGMADAWASPEEAYSALRRGRFRKTKPAEPPRRKLKTLELKSLDVLGLTEVATGPEIKARYKELVKRHHPDANGGDRSSEDLLQEIITAYNYLKSTGLC